MGNVSPDLMRLYVALLKDGYKIAKQYRSYTMFCKRPGYFFDLTWYSPDTDGTYHKYVWL
jgi:hypothetical protein